MVSALVNIPVASLGLVGVTRGGTFPLKKPATFFSHRPLESDDPV